MGILITQQVVNAVFVAGIYTVTAVGFSLVYGVMNIINMAHGSFIAIGAYTTHALWKGFGLDPLLSLPVSFGFAFLIGYLLQKLIINRIVRKAILISIVLTFGLSFLFLNANLLIWGSEYRGVTATYTGLSIEFGPILVEWTRLAIFVASGLFTLGLYLFMERTKLGSAIRATALNRDSAQLVGIEINHVYAVTYGLASGLAAVGGSLLALLYPLSPFMDASYLGKAFFVAVLGGLGNIWGAMVGGLVLSLAETAGVMTLGPAYQTLAGIVVFIVVLITRPHGLVGKRFYAEI